MKRVVYVVDDDDDVRASVEFLLESGNIEARPYASVVAFEAAFDPEVADCVLADLRMPGFSGLDLARRLHQHGYSVPVIIMTGHGGSMAVEEARKAGVFDFLKKPFDGDDLFDAIDRAMAG
ncbi:MAG: response regulator [Gammaproteobacteria bacterium]|nr:response regulator [Gammaproteobacteria bacterium]MBU1723819.1 response regulator [Gammaproteobacteria bacterium]MBU2007012.1 response regulator [Gammaproteobacteria bacterium]